MSRFQRWSRSKFATRLFPSRGLSLEWSSPGWGKFFGIATFQSHQVARFWPIGSTSPSIGYYGTRLGPRRHGSGGISHCPQHVGGSLPPGWISIEGHFSVFRSLMSGALVSPGRRSRNGGSVKVIVDIVVWKFFIVVRGFFAVAIFTIVFHTASQGSSSAWFCSLWGSPTNAVIPRLCTGWWSSAMVAGSFFVAFHNAFARFRSHWWPPPSRDSAMGGVSHPFTGFRSYRRSPIETPRTIRSARTSRAPRPWLEGFVDITKAMVGTGLERYHDRRSKFFRNPTTASSVTRPRRNRFLTLDAQITVWIAIIATDSFQKFVAFVFLLLFQRYLVEFLGHPTYAVSRERGCRRRWTVGSNRNVICAVAAVEFKVDVRLGGSEFHVWLVGLVSSNDRREKQTNASKGTVLSTVDWMASLLARCLCISCK